MKKKLTIAGCRLPIDFENQAERVRSTQNSRFKIQDFSAFTLVELLVVIAVIAILAAFVVPVARGVMRHSYISHAQAEMNQLETAIERYKNTYGFYPPGNGMTNQLYYELTGTTNVSPAGAPAVFQALDGTFTISSGDVNSAFGASGFVNCSKNNASEEDARAAQNFIGELKPGQIGTMNANGILVSNFVTSIGGPDLNYNPLNQSGQSPYPNPWRYRNPGTQNRNGYDLWIDLKINGKYDLICNWDTKVQIFNSPPDYAP